MSGHSRPEINKWLARRDRRRRLLHFTPTSSSWLNLIERWFKELTDRCHREPAGTTRVFTSVNDLATAIRTWAEHWNTDPKPFTWNATAEDIIGKVHRGRETLYQINTCLLSS